MTTIDVLCDAAVALKWFHSEGEDDAGSARALLDLHLRHAVMLYVLDAAVNDIGHVLLDGLRTGPGPAATVLDALLAICPRITPTPLEYRAAAAIAERHGLTFPDAVLASVADRRGATLVTMSPALLSVGLGLTPGELLTGSAQVDHPVGADSDR